MGQRRSWLTAVTFRGARTLAAVLGVVLMALLVRSTLLTPYVVESSSMTPTLGQGSLVLVDRISHRWSRVERDDLVVFHRGHSLVLKRVVGVSGDRVTVHDGVLVVNGRPVEEPYVDRASVDGTYLGTTTVPEGRIFVLGDRREGSIDSRTYGPVAIDQVLGRVLLHD